MKTLEILIPTFGRPNSAAGAIESVLACTDHRLIVRCNSNGYEPALERFRYRDVRLTYDCFETNQGVHRNIEFLLQKTCAKFCMLLSDEDRLDSEEVPRFLDFLECCDERHKVFSCSVYDLAHGRYYFKPPEWFGTVDLDIDMCLVVNPIPTYMSGLVFATDHLRQLDLKKLCQPLPGNDYLHLDIAQQLLLAGFFRYYLPKLVCKGDDIKMGGDGYSHRDLNSKETDGNLDLNPAIYGPYARARQFYFRERSLCNMREHVGLFPYVLRKLNLCSTFLRAIATSNVVVVLPHGIGVTLEARRAIPDAKNDGVYSGSLTASAFNICLLFPPAVLLLFGVLLGCSVVAVRKLFEIKLRLFFK